MKKYKVRILQTGYARIVSPSQMHADGTVTLIKGPKNIIVDTGGPWDREKIIDALAAEGLDAKDINYVICTHGHSDHIGNNNLFAGATFVVSFDISKGDLYTFHDFKSGAAYRIDEDIEVIATPGHTGQDVSVIVRTEEGTIAIVGDLYEREGDLEDESLWRANSSDPTEQDRARKKVFAVADFIIPGHGGMFRVRKP